jgi:hypothetical protein
MQAIERGAQPTCKELEEIRDDLDYLRRKDMELEKGPDLGRDPDVKETIRTTKSRILVLEDIEIRGRDPSCKPPRRLPTPLPNLGPAVNPGPTVTSKLVRPLDPNEKTGPAGFGPSQFIAAYGILPYRIEFENEADATAPAHRVVVTDQLDANLDWDTFAWTDFGFGDVLLIVPDGSRHFEATVPLTQNGHTFQVEIELSLDPPTGLLTAVFDSIDPATSLPPDAFSGFLPPDDGTGRGQGFLGYTVQPKAGLPTGTSIRNVARIIFDGNDPIDTNQVDPHDPSKGTDPAKEAFNTLDAGAPTSRVDPLPAFSPISFTVSWSGSDDPGGSGIASFDVFVSDNGGPPTAFLTATTQTSATFTGQVGHTYAFTSVATDRVGHRQPLPAAAQATTTVAAPSMPPPVQTPPAPRGITARLVTVKVRKRKTRLVVDVFFADTGAKKSEIPSPFQASAFKGIRVSVRDSNGDGAADQVVLTARKGKKPVTAVFPS